MSKIPYAEEAMKIIDWLLKKGKEEKLAVLTLILLCFFGYNYFSQKVKLEQVVSSQSKEIVILTNENIDLRKQLNALSSEIMVFKASTDYFPFPYWVKNTDGKMIYINTAYEKKYLYPLGLSSIDYINHYDVDIWGEEVAAQFRQNDMQVYSQGLPISYLESINDSTTIQVTKYPFKIGDQIFGVAGVEYQIF